MQLKGPEKIDWSSQPYLTEGESTLIVLTTIGNRTTESTEVQDLNLSENKGETGLMTSAVKQLYLIKVYILKFFQVNYNLIRLITKLKCSIK